MKLILAGASGRLGQKLVPRLAQDDVDVLLVGRHVGKLQDIFPTHTVCSYDDLERVGQGFDTLVNFATLNTDALASEEDFHNVNVSFCLKLVQTAKQIGLKRFINLSSIHALDDTNQSSYAKSKRTAIVQLSQQKEIEIVTLFLPFVYDERWDRQLSFLNALPAPLSAGMLQGLTALKPSLHVSNLKEFLVANEKSNSGDSIILTAGQSENGCFKFLKRLFDVSVAVVVPVVLSWLLVLIWLLVKVTSRGPGLFSQVRVGKGGKMFTCYKFRTMAVDTPHVGTHEVSIGSITNVGRVLRRLKLDELPQLWNILKGEMSVVGPRPCLPTQTELIDLRQARGVLAIRPGVTGYAQVQGIDMSNPERLARTDAEYVALQSMLLDIKIVFKTLIGKGAGDRVRRQQDNLSTDDRVP